MPSLDILAKVSDVNCQDHRKRTALRALAKTNCTTSETYLVKVHGKYNGSLIFISNFHILLGQGALLGTQNDRSETPLLQALESGALFSQLNCFWRRLPRLDWTASGSAAPPSTEQSGPSRGCEEGAARHCVGDVGSQQQRQFDEGARSEWGHRPSPGSRKVCTSN
jgi:hypothetical protein